MKKIKYLQVGFEHPITAWEVQGIRGAIIKTAGEKHRLFHNHLEDGYRYKYPLIQYKRHQGRPLLISLDEGIEEIHHFFEHMQEGVMLGNRPYNMVVSDIRMQQFTLQVWDKLFDYRIVNWLALNPKNYEEYAKTDELSKRLELLTKVLTGNILSMAKGIDWHIEKPVEIKITHIYEPRLLSYKQTKLMAFNLTFRSNVFLPPQIGLGKGASSGFGVIKKMSRNDL